MMNATFKLDGCTTLRVGTDLMLPNEYQPRGYVALLLERKPLNGPGDPELPVQVTTLATLPPSYARALASVLLSAATEARQQG